MPNETPKAHEIKRLTSPLTFKNSKAYDIEGRKINVRAREELAIAFQHELDHLNGMIFTDHIDPKNPFKDQEKMRAI